MTFPVISAEAVPPKAVRTSKTTPLRNAMAQLQIGEAIEVAYHTANPEAGYRATTISQVAGTMSGAHPTIKFKVRRKADGTGCFVVATAKPANTDEA